MKGCRIKYATHWHTPCLKDIPSFLVMQRTNSSTHMRDIPCNLHTAVQLHLLLAPGSVIPLLPSHGAQTLECNKHSCSYLDELLCFLKKISWLTFHTTWIIKLSFYTFNIISAALQHGEKHSKLSPLHHNICDKRKFHTELYVPTDESSTELKHE